MTNPFSRINSINNFLTKNISSLTDSFRKLSSGQRITKAADDAAGLAIAESLKSSAATLNVASRNVGDAQSALQIADGALQQVSEIGSRLKELATQASNGTLSDDQRTALQAEYSELSQEVQRITETTEFNGTKLLNDSSFTAQVGTGSDSNSQIATSGVSIQSAVSNVSSQNIGTQAGAQAALAQVDSLINSAASARGQIGATSARLEAADNNIKVRRENELTAESRIRDVDVAEETAKLTSNQIRSNAAVAVSAQSKLTAARVFDLLR